LTIFDFFFGFVVVVINRLFRSFHKEELTMAAAVVLNAVFDRLGFHADARELIFDEGYNTFRSIGELEDSDIDHMVSKLSKLYPPNPTVAANQDPNRNRRFPTRAVSNLKAMAFWIREQQRIGGNVQPQDFTDAVIDTVKTRIREDTLLVKSLQGQDIPKPQPLKSWDDWPKYKNLFLTYVRQIRSVALCPLSYVVRPDPVVTNLERNFIYPSNEERLIRCTLHQGSWFRQDNARLWNELKTTVIDGPAWAFTQQYDREGRGRQAWMALVQQAEGDASMNLRKQRAYAAVANARYVGERPRFGFSDYISVHQRAYNELLELGEPVSESKKVTDFMAGIQDSKMETSKAIVIGSPAMHGDFDATQTFLQHFVETSNAQKRSTRNVSAADTVPKKKENNRRQNSGKKKDKKQSGGSEKIHSGNYTQADWRALTPDEQEQVRELRKQDKANKKRKVSAVMTRPLADELPPVAPAVSLPPALPPIVRA